MVKELDMALINDHHQCLYKGGLETARDFRAGEVIPDGWVDRPNATEWDNPPVQPERSSMFADISRMRKEDLLVALDLAGIEADGEMTVVQLRELAKKVMNR